MLTVATAATDRSLLTIAELRAAVGIDDASQDARLTAIGNRAAALICSACGVATAPPTPPTLRAEVLTETWRAVCAGRLMLSRWPVSSITSIVVDGVTLGVDEYEFEAGAGHVFRLSGVYRIDWSGDLVTVVYTAGYATVPDDLKLAAERVVLDIYASSARDPNLRSVQVDGIGTETYWVAPQSDPMVSQEVMDLLAPYMNWRV